MRNVTAGFWVAVLAFTGCRSAGPTAATTASADPPKSTGESRRQTPTVPTLMKDHEKHGAAMRDAVARGDLVTAKREGKFLAELRIEGPIDPAWKLRLDAMNAAAARVAKAPDLTQASHALGGVAKTCAECHTMLGRPRPPVGEPAGQGSGVRPAMERHQWAATQLWQGLVIPSDDAWKAGALAMSEARLAPEAFTPGQSPVPKIAELEKRVHDLGRKAQSVEQLDSRVQVYGELMATCADCHRWLGGGPRKP